jgi:hypothetical protein
MWIWSWKNSANLTFFVLLQAFEREDQFVVEIAWSEDGEYPWHVVGNLNVEQSHGRDRLGQLWRQGADEPVWDVTPEKTVAQQEALEALRLGESPKYPPDPPVDQILPRVCPLVRDAVTKLEEYGIPLFRQIAKSRGLAWLSEAKK